MRLPIVFTIILLVFGLLLDIYIYKHLRGKYSVRGRQLPVRRIFVVSSVLSQSLLIICLFWPKRDADASLIPVMWLLYTWGTIYISKALYVICGLISDIPLIFKRKRLPLGKYVGIPLGLICFALMWWGALWGREQIQVTEVELSSAKVPASFDGFRIVQFSDAHLGTWGSDTRFAERLVSRINSLNPDIIVFTGDLVNRRSAEAEPFVKVLSQLKAKYGVYSVMGNHDYGDYTDWPDENAHKADAAHLREIEQQAGWHLLDNTHTFIRIGADSIALIGVENWGEPPFKQYGRLEAAYPQSHPGEIADSNFKILLSHNPMHWREQVRTHTDIDLTLSGHTHAMQMSMGWLWSPSAWRYPEWGGMYLWSGDKEQRKAGMKVSVSAEEESPASRLYVNVGCGEVAIPARIGAAPEITLITLHHEQ